jgi:hypothetical protein
VLVADVAVFVALLVAVDEPELVNVELAVVVTELDTVDDTVLVPLLVAVLVTVVDGDVTSQFRNRVAGPHQIPLNVAHSTAVE